ncbi:MAG: hypothetical protein OJJ21_15905 [Ferrovibrio sp.]|uniref:hypothetical protein n=1 Tax=Ferrovibrio sp. TaxID=1917215 RepID=UPI0026074888|nr:hypothetical protein [Ferrovibrio sp.]MCW0235086.1 hypothetical protein [Ferrovibrio sp.]
MKAVIISAVLLTLPILALLGGCSSAPGRPPEPQPIASPNGEPLGYVTDSRRCEALLADWFQRTDTDRDSTISLAELEADARRWFARGDTDGDGVIIVTELTALRRSLEPPAAPRPVRRSGLFDDGDTTARREVDLVMAADVNLDFRVTLDEMLALTARRYAIAIRRGPYDRSVATADCERRRFR